MPNIPSLEEMLKAGVHFGHRTSRWHPKMQDFLFGARAGVHVIDVEKTQKILEEVTAEIAKLTAEEKTVWFIATKQQLKPVIEKYAVEAKTPFVNTRWLGGTFTNFDEIRKLIKNYLDLIDKRDKGELKKYTKLEQLQFDRKIEDLYDKIGGLADVKDLPDAIFLLDLRTDKTAAVEARKRGIKVFAVCDSNVNPKLADVVIPANDDSIRSATLIARLMAEAITEGRANRGKNDAPKQNKASKTGAGKVEKVKKDEKVEAETEDKAPESEADTK